MAEAGVYAFSIRKSTNWRGGLQGFGNVYHYRVEAPSEGLLNSFLAALKAAEVPIHSTAVNFVEGRAWGPVQSNGRGGRMEAVTAFSGTGSTGVTTGFYKEFAYLFQWPLGRYGSRNRPQFLRKWIHSCGSVLGTSTGLDGTTNILPALANANTYIAAVRSITPVGGGPTYDLMSASEHIPTGPGVLYPYLEHHQFGR